MSTPTPAGSNSFPPAHPNSFPPAHPNVVRERLPLLAAGAAVFVVLLVATAVTQNNTLGSIVAVYGIVGGVLLGLLLAKGERQRDGSVAGSDDV